jgi:hypothetical protein
VGIPLATTGLKRTRGVKRWIIIACFVLLFVPTLVELLRAVRAVVGALH